MGELASDLHAAKRTLLWEEAMLIVFSADTMGLAGLDKPQYPSCGKGTVRCIQ
jgi:hypothetical protein